VAIVTYKILLVDDCIEDLETYRRYLVRGIQNSYDILEASTGTEALFLCQQQLPDVVVLDYLLPDMDGLEFMDDLMTLFGPSCPSVIMITGQGSEKIAVQAIKSGAADYLVKKNTTQLNFLTAIENVLEKSRLSQQLKESEAGRKKAEASLQVAHQQVINIWEGMTDAYTMLDSEWRVIYTNPTSMQLLCQVTNLEPEQILGKTHWELFPWTVGKTIEFEYRRAVQERVPVYLELFYEPSGNWFEIRAYPSEMGLGLYFHDITNRKRREANSTFLAEIADDLSRLSSADEIMQAIGTKVGIHLNISNCLFTQINEDKNQAIVEYTWHTSDTPDLTGIYRLSDFITPEFSQAAHSEEIVIIRNTQTDPRINTERYAAFSILSFITVPFHRNGKWKYLFTVNDSVPRDWNEDEIELIREVTNRAFPRLERARAEATVAADLKNTQLLRDLSARLITEDNTQVLYNEIVTVAITLMRADGGSFQILDESTQELVLLALQGFNQKMFDNFNRIDASFNTSCGIALATAQRSFVNYDVPESDDPKAYLRMLLNSGYLCGQSTPLFSRSGKLIGVVSTHWHKHYQPTEHELRFLDLLVRQAADSVEQRQAELEIRKLEQQFYQTQRLESLGVLASGIAHDLNNILTPILAVAQLLPLKLPNLEQKNRQFLQILEDSSKRGVELVKQITAFARGAEGKQVPLQLRHLLKEIEQVVKSTFPKSIATSVNITSPHLWTVSADPTQIHQVLMNLCVNARDAMADGGTLTLSAENFHVDANYVRMNLQAKVGDYVLITVSDTGCGIPEQIKERIFDPFFTTKEIAQGTGLGLSTVTGIIKNHSGFINVRSEVEKGSQFQVFLRAIEASVTEDTKDFKIGLGNGELILVVDDEVFIRETTKTSLEELNYRVLIAGDSIEAFSLFVQHQNVISVVLMDIQMPSINGFQAIRILQKMNPSVKIIVITGLISNQRVLEENQINVQGFLSKPYTLEELLGAIEKVLTV
jgi:signal transduction histidine kinase/DNA-binding response OmpR family regulator